MANNKEIDEVNILNATILSMKRALEKFNGYTNTVKIDGQKFLITMKKHFLLKRVILNLYQLPLHQFWQKLLETNLCVTTQNNFQHTIGTGTKGMGLDNILPQ